MADSNTRVRAYLGITGEDLPLDWMDVFGGPRPLEVEIGFGTGEYLCQIARERPQVGFIGFEQAPGRIVKTRARIEAAGLRNVRLLFWDAVWGLQYLFSSGSLDAVHCLFPCPWPKKRHAKNRLFQPRVLSLVNDRLRMGGTLTVVTDEKAYAAWLMEQVPGTGFLVEAETHGARYGTMFEAKWRAEGQEDFYKVVLRKEQALSSLCQEVARVRIYDIQKMDPAKMVLRDEKRKAAITFGEIIHDQTKAMAMVLAIVTEEGQTQHLWIKMVRGEKGWSVRAAEGSLALPTPGAHRALALVSEAAVLSGGRA
ncbi:MAG: hypothetical protein GX606_05300 [Elusimicrobia bacterium]|nr:hypothetical protein [Elusimicrobiota bacterium]